MSESKYGVVVGVTGPRENTAALRAAAEEAALLQAPVTLAHAVHAPLPPRPPNVLSVGGPLTEVGEKLVGEVAAELAALAGPGTTSQTLVRHEHPGRLLAGLSADADLVVLAHRDLSGARRLVTGSTAASVAGHAHCPVLSVPVGWSPPGGQEDGAYPVTVGIHEAGASRPVLQAAFEFAARHETSVRLVHAWRVEGVYDDVILDRVDPDWSDRIATEVRTSVEPLVAEFPGVPVEVVVPHQWPADALVALASSSRLLVVGRHGHLSPMPTRLGSIAHAVIRNATCPVMVTPV